MSNIVAAAVGVYVWVGARGAATLRRVEELERMFSSRLDQAVAEHAPMTLAVARLEEHARHAPDDSDIARVHERIDRLAEGVSEIRGGVKRIEHAVDLMHSYLLDQGVK